MSKEFIADTFYDNHLKKELGETLSFRENELALKIFKSISFSIWSDNVMTVSQTEDIFNEYNKKNLILMIKNVIETIKENNITTGILLRDLTDIPKHCLFYNQNINHSDKDSALNTVFNNIEVFSSDDLKIGIQEGYVDENGHVVLNYFEESHFNEDSCYVMLSTKRTKNLTDNTESEHIFLDYYLGNNSFN